MTCGCSTEGFVLAGTDGTISGAGGFSALISGVLLAIFLYSGWDTAAYVGEEAHGKTAGPAAVTSVVLLFVIYSVGILAFQGIAPGHVMQAHARTSWRSSASRSAAARRGSHSRWDVTGCSRAGSAR